MLKFLLFPLFFNSILIYNSLKIKSLNYNVKDTVDYKIVLIGDSNAADKINVASILNNQNNIAVYHEAIKNRTIAELEYLLENDANLISAIQHSTHVIVFFGADDTENTINRGIDNIFKLINNKNKNAGIIAIDLPISGNSKTTIQREIINNQIAASKKMLLYHYKTNTEIIKPVYNADLTLSEKNIYEIAKYLALNIFEIPNADFSDNYKKCYTNTHSNIFCELPINEMQKISIDNNMGFPFFESKKVNTEITENVVLDPNLEMYKIYDTETEKIENVYILKTDNNKNLLEIKDKTGETEVYYLHQVFFDNKWTDIYFPIIEKYQDEYILFKDGYNLNKKILFPRFNDPTKNQKCELKLAKNIYYKIIAGMNIPIDSSENYVYDKVCEWENYIATLEMDEQLKWLYWKSVFINGIYYKNNPFSISISEEMKDFSQNIYYTEAYDSLGTTKYTKNSLKVGITPLPDILIMYAMLYSSFEIEKQFPELFPAYIMNLVKLSLGNNETKQVFGIQTDNGVIPILGAVNKEDAGGLQLNYSTAEYLCKLNPEFYAQFFKLNTKERKIIFHSWLSEQMMYTYTIAMSKVPNGFATDVDFAQIALKASAWHRSKLSEKHRYVQSLKINLILYDKFFSQFIPKDEQITEIIAEVIRTKLQREHAGKYIRYDEFQLVEKVVVNNKDVLATTYPSELAELTKKLVIDLTGFKENFSSNVIIEPQYCEEVTDIENTVLFVDKDGHVLYTFKKNETLYQLGQNRIRKWVNYHNTVVEDYQKGKKFIISAESKQNIIILNAKFLYEELPAELHEQYSKQQYEIMRDSIDYEYFIFREFQKMGYEIKVRVGDYKEMKKDIHELKDSFFFGSLTSPQYKNELLKLNSKYRFVYKDDVFFVPPTDFLYLKQKNNFFILNLYLNSIIEKAKIEGEVIFMQDIINNIQKNN